MKKVQPGWFGPTSWLLVGGVAIGAQRTVIARRRNLHPGFGPVA